MVKFLVAVIVFLLLLQMVYGRIAGCYLKDDVAKWVQMRRE